jgi:cell division protein DivIC
MRSSNVKRFPAKIPRQPMQDSQEPLLVKKKVRWRYPKRTCAAVLFVMLFGYIIFFAAGQQLQLRQLQADIAALTTTRDMMLEENKLWEEKMLQLEKDEAIEKIAREQLGMIKPGEKLLIIRQ